MAYHIIKRNNNNIIVSKTKKRIGKGWTNLAKGVNRAERTRRELEQVLKLPVFAEYKEKLRGYAYSKYNISGITEEANGKLHSYKSNRLVTTYQTQSDRNRWRKWFNGIMSGKIKPTDDRYASGLMNKEALKSKHINLQQFRTSSSKNRRAKISLRKRVQFGLSATMYDSDTLANRDFNMDFDDVSRLGKELRNGNFSSVDEWIKAGHGSQAEVAFYNSVTTGRWEQKRDLIAKEREQKNLLD